MTQKMPQNLAAALSMGWACFLLTFSLFAAPLVASQQDFAHLHHEATTFHYHPLHSFKPHLSSVMVRLEIIWLTLFIIHPKDRIAAHREAAILAFFSRAPPLEMP